MSDIVVGDINIDELLKESESFRASVGSFDMKPAGEAWALHQEFSTPMPAETLTAKSLSPSAREERIDCVLAKTQRRAELGIAGLIRGLPAAELLYLGHQRMVGREAAVSQRRMQVVETMLQAMGIWRGNFAEPKSTQTNNIRTETRCIAIGMHQGIGLVAVHRTLTNLDPSEKVYNPGIPGYVEGQEHQYVAVRADATKDEVIETLTTGKFPKPAADNILKYRDLGISSKVISHS